MAIESTRLCWCPIFCEEKNLTVFFFACVRFGSLNLYLTVTLRFLHCVQFFILQILYCVQYSRSHFMTNHRSNQDEEVEVPFLGADAVF